jgi:hypothetical protein
MPIQATPDLMQKYASKRIKYKGFDKSVELYEKLRVHAKGEVPEEIICERRPSESERIKDYRRKIYVPKTKNPIGKVITSLSKIRRSQDWSINYDPSAVPPIVAGREDETLEAYCEDNFPYFKSVTSWAFSVLLKEMQIDANAVEAIWPLNWSPEPTEFFRPYPYIFHSDQVLDYVMEDYAVLQSDDTVTYTVKDVTYANGIVIYVIDSMSVQRWEQYDVDYKMRQAWAQPHGLGFAPVRRLGGVLLEAVENMFIFESRIQDMVPCLDEAARIYSDLQAEIVQHVHSDKWIYSQTECRHCNGNGWQMINQTKCDCQQCNGVGYINVSPYSTMVLRPQSAMEGGAAIPTPPAGYIQKADVALMVKEIDNQVDKQLYGALSAVNMEFLAKTPLNESGLSKEVDKDELNNFVHLVAEDLVAVMDWTYYVINEYRYKDIVPDKKARKAMLPSIPVPEKFDLLSSVLLLDDIEKATRTKLSPVIQNELQIEYAAKKFYNNREVKEELETVFKVDPFPNITEEDKMVRLSNEGITKVDYVISSNIQQFVRRAIEEYENFASMTMAERKKIIEKYANEVIKKNSIKNQIMQDLGGNPDDPTSTLRSSVGGLTGMIEIVKAVASGVYDLDAAVALVSQRFGVSEEEARKQLGTPQTITNPQQANQIAQLT